MLTKVIGTTQVLTSATGGATTSTSFTGVKKVRIATTTAIHVAFGENPTASATDLIIGADQAEHFSFTFTPAQKVSVLAVATAGKVSITPIA